MTEQTTFTIASGDIIEIDDNDGEGIKRYRVEHVSANGALRATNLRTHLSRHWPGYGRIVPAGPAAVCGFCTAALTPDGTKHLPPYGEHEEPIIVIRENA